MSVKYTVLQNLELTVHVLQQTVYVNNCLWFLEQWIILIISRLPLKWTKNIYFYLLEFTIMNIYHAHLLWFKIITLTIQTDVSKAPNTRHKKSASNSDRKARKASCKN
jgi:hypothetical protein